MTREGKAGPSRNEPPRSGGTAAARAHSAHPTDEARSSGGVAELAALPLRLSVARGGLGLELCEPLGFGPLIVEEMEVALPGISYPLDLSKGVKHFRNRRSALRHAVVRLDLQRLAGAWQRALAETSWGPGVKVRLRPIYEAKAQSAKNETMRTTSLAVSIYSRKSALAFDLVVTSGTEPRLVVDTPRAVGLPEPALQLAVRALDVGLAASTGDAFSLARAGRALELGGLCETIALLVLPQMGCRLPSVIGQVVRDVRIDSGGLLLTIGARQEPFPSGRRGLRVAGVAEFLCAADEALIAGDLVEARAQYLDALERAPGHQEALQELIEIDLIAGERAEAALSFVEELEAALSTDKTPELMSRHGMTAAEALDRTSRRDLATEALRSAADVESDAVVASLLYCKLAARSSDKRAARELLDIAVTRAPFLGRPREDRFRLALSQADLKTAMGDAEQLEAAQALDGTRAATCMSVARELSRAGYDELGLKWTKRALRLDPDSPDIMIELSRRLAESGESLRACELLQSALRRLSANSKVEVSSEAGSDERVEVAVRMETGVREHEDLREMAARARLDLARLLVEQGASVAEVLVHLGDIETRSGAGVEARMMEAELHHQEGRVERRDRSLSRLLEALELGWVTIDRDLDRLKELLKLAGDDPSLVSFARRVLENSGSPREDDDEFGEEAPLS